MRKGFTLIELLAVIIIIAIIALITTPIIIGVITNSKKESIIRSAEYIARAAQNAYLDNQAKIPSERTLMPISQGGNEYEISQLDLDNPPLSGTFIVDQNNYDITINNAVFEEYICSGTVANMVCVKN
ncbi:MAG: prepilin-type N-terminal cleavage/methylation domain-containing protein [Bacilli bacterium]|nr:prepilin-type N-terminal cleavage/methylation domain-containing protein [Bacilli bacterium]